MTLLMTFLPFAVQVLAIASPWILPKSPVPRNQGIVKSIEWDREILCGQREVRKPKTAQKSSTQY